MGQSQLISDRQSRFVCFGGKCDKPLDFSFLFAFQPIVNIKTGMIYAQEALVRGLKGEGAGSILSKVNDSNRYIFDQTAREKALQSALSCHWDGLISINFMPNAVFSPAHCLRRTLATCEKLNLNPSRIIFEWSEKEYINDAHHIENIISTYQHLDFKIAFDDFGRAHSNLNLLTRYHPNIIKLDRHYVINIEKDKHRQAIVKAMISLCRDLNIDFVVEGVETIAEFDMLSDIGVELMQGFLLARPALMDMPKATIPYVI
ncbi:MAG: EAL domain-containing protein [Zymomonas mobilis subsp. pomaceae]|uniref:Diguanylate phosphodiesterase n=1 Tax=Zymomonas mobilis subsp. pomaceae (strain ATCC 29192 / DSM 22645 / JCM 10191 / CCUG 17912 / NBRC 13757 / NCIMB 11200 / NRRL B-4491 / Barker I) TaxID=579138 RepID=F8EW88_ZYMMT|nr:EAL domain-containing protein [Zymomonas mobilis]AEI38498.1 diguanylate phosphodiesterase [Zymomonas mobilis subsp. pomaceae ATCC 29192]MDX5948187.1 EAL domain-containing protein [Zymomonas mobilis subsp. pomaceae]GEB89873.1 diguanylate phosphodiesterase [Zymomonas mobilis subsp. pomaceae]